MNQPKNLKDFTMSTDLNATLLPNDFQRETWEKNYRYKDETVLETYQRVAKTIFSDDEEKAAELTNAMMEFGISFGGRVVANIGTDRKNVSVFNCYAAQRKTKPVDSISGIFDDVKVVAEILKTEGGAGMAMCFKFDTPISVIRDGKEIVVNIEDVKKTDFVYTTDGLRRVVETLISEKSNMIELEFDNGEIFHCTEDHPFLVLRSDIPVWVEAKDIVDTDEIVLVNTEGGQLTQEE
jgi:ribonucleotide reductase alpha subunit